MNKQEYLSELESHLASLSDDERANAIQFYDEYFEDAGPENEQQVISELGKPFALAKSIICEQSAYSKSKSYANYKASISSGLQGSAEPDIEPDIAPDAAPQQPHTQYTAYSYAEADSSNQSSENTTYGSYDKYKDSYGNSADSGSYNTSGYGSSSNTRYDESYKNDGENYGRRASGSPNTASFVLFLLLVVFVIAPFALILGVIALVFIIGAALCVIGAIGGAIYSIVKASLLGIGTAVFILGLAMMFLPIGLLLAAKALPKLVKWTANIIRILSGGLTE